MYLAHLSVLLCISTCHCLIKNEGNEKHCGLLKQWLESTSVTAEISNSGFHRDLVTTVELSHDVSHVSEVRLLLVYTWPRGVYVDPYQLATLVDQSNWQILLDSDIDLEAPAHKTSGFMTYAFPTLNGPTSRLLKITIPVHGRYNEPTFDGKTFTSVNIKPPELLLQTEKCMQLINLSSSYPYIVMDAPCTADNSSMCSWIKMQHQQEHGIMSLQFPVGDGSLVTSVCSGTLLVTLICCVELSRHMWKHQL